MADVTLFSSVEKKKNLISPGGKREWISDYLEFKGESWLKMKHLSLNEELSLQNGGRISGSNLPQLYPFSISSKGSIENLPSIICIPSFTGR